MNKLTVLEIKDLPFCLGAMQNSSNPGDLPNIYPFRLHVNYDLARLEQVDDPALESLLDRVYRVGSEMGTPSDSTELGKPYVEDFMNFIHDFLPVNGSLLEIGAGTGFLSKCLLDAGWHVTSIEPGQGYAHHWVRHGVKVINDFFPSKKINGKFNAIVFYTVLEHIKDTRTFLESVKQHLNPGGMIFLGVPDCSTELYAGDPGILLHEHYQYFTLKSLVNTLCDAGFAPQVNKSLYGRSLFAAGSISFEHSEEIFPDKSEISVIQCYLKNVALARITVQTALNTWQKSGFVGIYCPSRILNYLEGNSDLCFYDDADDIQGMYYPPFNTPVLSREQLILNPPKTLLIASRTFGDKLKQELTEQGLILDIFTLNELVK